MNISTLKIALITTLIAATLPPYALSNDNSRISSGHGGGASESNYGKEKNRSDTSLYTFYGLTNNPNSYDSNQYKKTVTINNSGDVYGYCKQSTNQYEDVFARAPALLKKSGNLYKCGCEKGYDVVPQGRDQDSSGNWTVTYYACAVSGSGYVAIDQPDEPAPPPPPPPTSGGGSGKPIETWQLCWNDTDYNEYLRKKRAGMDCY